MREPGPNLERVEELTAALSAYRLARQRMLTVLNLDISNRDPLAEWSEHLVAALTGGILAPSRVQAGYDLTTPDGLRVQVRYLANSSNPWVNGHPVRLPAGADLYALVLFESFDVIGVLMFPPRLAPICDALGKRHGERDVRLDLYQPNWLTIRDDPQRFRRLGMQVWLPPFSMASTTDGE